MDAQTIIARRVALELRPGNLVNLGIGIPTLVANYVPAGHQCVLPVRERPDRHRTDSRARPGASAADRRRRQADQRASGRVRPSTAPCRSALIRGGHVDITVLGGLQVDAQRTSRQLDDPRQDGAGHGRRDGSRDRRQARHRRHAARRKGQVEDRRRSAICR